MSSYVISFASPQNCIPTFLLRFIVAEIQHGNDLKSLSPKSYANVKHLFPINIHLTPHLSWAYLFSRRSKYWISFISISTHLLLQPRITVLASNNLLSNFTRNRPKILLFNICASKARSTMTRIGEGALLRLNILTCQFSIILTNQIPVFLGLISFDIRSWF